MTFTPTYLYAAFEGTITTLEKLDKVVVLLESEQRRDRERLFAYRGVADANFGFFSSLYRRLWWTEAATPPTRREA
jgi:hypothetical protein